MPFGMGSLSGITKKFNFSQIFKIGMSFIMLDMQTTMLNNMGNLPQGVKSLAGISLQLAKFGLIAKLGKGLPFGLGSILSTITALQATTYAISQIPALFTLFRGTSWTGTGQQFYGGAQAPDVGGGGPTGGSFPDYLSPWGR